MLNFGNPLLFTSPKMGLIYKFTQTDFVQDLSFF